MGMPAPNANYCGVSLSKEGIMLLFGSGNQIKAYRKNDEFKPVADFRAVPTKIFKGESINFFDQSSYSPTEWNWQFPGAYTQTSTDQNPQNISYPAEGTYEVILTASNLWGGDSLVKSCYIEVLSPVNVDEEINKPEAFSLSQNYPNPFNPVTKISWQSAVGSWQTLRIYDVLGNEIATLVNEFKPVGKYEVEFDGSNLPSGIYFYTLKAGIFNQTKKMLLLK